MANTNADGRPRHFITLAMAREMTARYRNLREKLLAPDFMGKDILPISETFDKTAIQALLDQPGCVSFRTYLGMDENLEIRIIFVGVNDKDEDITTKANTTDGGATDDPVILEEGTRCPPMCPLPTGP